jgi:2-amino-4-hydroxy-6-hydroxymethyldihydropteridine diphosphokinase
LAEAAFVALGSNVDPEANLRRGALLLAELDGELKLSRVWFSRAVGPPGQPDFLNAGARLITDLGPQELRARLREIERICGRLRTSDRYAPRTLDLDLCLLGDRCGSWGGLVLPDPELLERAHLLLPLADLEPGLTVPGTSLTLAEAAARVADRKSLRLRDDLDLTP